MSDPTNTRPTPGYSALRPASTAEPNAEALAAVDRMISALRSAAYEINHLRRGPSGREAAQATALRHWAGPHADRFRRLCDEEAYLFSAAERGLLAEAEEWVRYRYSLTTP